MRSFGLYLNNSDEELIDKCVTSDLNEAYHYFCGRKNLNLHDLLIIFYIKEIE